MRGGRGRGVCRRDGEGRVSGVCVQGVWEKGDGEYVHVSYIYTTGGAVTEAGVASRAHRLKAENRF